MTHSGLYLGSLRTFLCHGKMSPSTSAHCVSMLILTLVHLLLIIILLILLLLILILILTSSYSPPGLSTLFCNMLHGLFHAQNM